MGVGAPCVYVALQQPAGSVATFTLFMAASSAMTFVYYSTVYSAIQDVVEPRLRGTAVSLYFFAMYVLGASFGSTILGVASDYFANRRCSRPVRPRWQSSSARPGSARPCT